MRKIKIHKRYAGIPTIRGDKVAHKDRKLYTFLTDKEFMEYLNNSLLLELIMKKNLIQIPVTEKPYCVTVENTTSKPLDAVIFGFNRFHRHKNFGSPEGIVVSSAFPIEFGYEMLFSQSASNPFVIEFMRFISKSRKQIQQVIGANYHDANGRSSYDPIPLKNHYKRGQIQKNIIEVHYPMLIDGKMHLTILMLPKTQLTIYIYPKKDSICDLRKAHEQITKLENRFNELVDKLKNI